jgi:hypothetical protein
MIIRAKGSAMLGKDLVFHQVQRRPGLHGHRFADGFPKINTHLIGF